MKPIIKSHLFYLLLTLFFLSCINNRIFRESYTFDDYSWNSNEKIAFNPHINQEQIGKSYQMTLHIRYITGFSYKYLNLLILINKPDGSQLSKELSIQMLTEDKKYRGEGMGDIWDLDYSLEELLEFNESGSYQIEIKSLMGEEQVNFINEIGISISKPENTE